MNADYTFAVNESVKVLQEYGCLEVPIDLNVILKALKRTIQVCSYTKFSADSGLTLNEIVDLFESDLGACVYDPRTERYVIYYNDTKENIGLARFTIAHELGHIFLEHHKLSSTDILLRAYVADEYYRKFENEANCFARNLLSPQPLVKRFTDISKNQSVDDMVIAFNISYFAALTRRQLYSNDGFRIKKSHKDYFEQYTIKYGYFCVTCKSAEVNESSAFCKICGTEHPAFVKGIDRLNYNYSALSDSSRKALKCPKCGNEDLGEADYCKDCGTPLYNYCVGDETHRSDVNARFCEICGNPTEYFRLNLLKPWEDYRSKIDEMLEDKNNPF